MLAGTLDDVTEIVLSVASTQVLARLGSEIIATLEIKTADAEQRERVVITR